MFTLALINDRTHRHTHTWHFPHTDPTALAEAVAPGHGRRFPSAGRRCRGCPSRERFGTSRLGRHRVRGRRCGDSAPRFRFPSAGSRVEAAARPRSSRPLVSPRDRDPRRLPVPSDSQRHPAATAGPSRSAAPRPLLGAPRPAPRPLPLRCGARPTAPPPASRLPGLGGGEPGARRRSRGRSRGSAGGAGRPGAGLPRRVRPHAQQAPQGAAARRPPPPAGSAALRSTASRGSGGRSRPAAPTPGRPLGPLARPGGGGGAGGLPPAEAAERPCRRFRGILREEKAGRCREGEPPSARLFASPASLLLLALMSAAGRAGWQRQSGARAAAAVPSRSRRRRRDSAGSGATPAAQLRAPRGAAAAAPGPQPAPPGGGERPVAAAALRRDPAPLSPSPRPGAAGCAAQRHGVQSLPAQLRLGGRTSVDRCGASRARSRFQPFASCKSK